MADPSPRTFGMELQNNDVLATPSPTAASEVSVAQRRDWLLQHSKMVKQQQPPSNNTSHHQQQQSIEPVKRKMVHKTVSSDAPTPLPTAAANALVRRILPKTVPNKSSSDVQATNDGYASVAKLSQWLADDPTSTKKKVLLRPTGANIFEKAKQFDKGLEQQGVSVVLKPTTIGSVAKHRQWLEQQQQQQLSSSSSKPWNVTLSPPRKTNRSGAQSDIFVSNHDRSLASLAKQKWRRRTSVVSAATTNESSSNNNKSNTTAMAHATAPPPIDTTTTVHRSPKNETTTTKQSVVVVEPLLDSEPSPVEPAVLSYDNDEHDKAAVHVARNHRLARRSVSTATIKPKVAASRLMDSKNEEPPPTQQEEMAEKNKKKDATKPNHSAETRTEDHIISTSSSLDSDTENKLPLPNPPPNKNNHTKVANFRRLRESFARRSFATTATTKQKQQQPPPVKQITKVPNDKEPSTTQNDDNKKKNDAVSPLSASSVSTTRSSARSDTEVLESAPSFITAVTATSVSTNASAASSKSSSHEPKSSHNMGFQQARNLLVERAKANGNNVDVLVQRRRAKFERLQKISKRKTEAHGMLRASWEEEKQGSYVKTYREDAPKKKSLDQLP